MTSSYHEPVGSAEWLIFGRVRCGVFMKDCYGPGFIPTRSTRQSMQYGVSLYALQTNPGTDDYAVVNGYRISVDAAQATVHFYDGEQEWGRLAGSVPVDKWTGDWLIRSVGRFFRIDYQLDEDKAIATIQQNGYLTVVAAHRIGQATLYQRLLIGSLWDYAIVYRRDVGFGLTAGGAIAELRHTLSLRAESEQAEVVLRVGAGSRFSTEALADFCAANGLTPGGRYTKQELRKSVLRQRKLNCEHYRDQLNYFGIRINCR